MNRDEYGLPRPGEVAGTRDVDAVNAIMREHLGDNWADNMIPRPDPVADLVKAYKLIEGNPGYRPFPGPIRWIRLTDILNDETP